jgi:membrane protease YdiL (CAAX protease family)
MDNTCLFSELLQFDSNRPVATNREILLSSVAIFVLSTLIYSVSMRVFAGKLLAESKSDRKKEYTVYKSKGVSPRMLVIAELLNAGVYAPFAEELFFRFFLFKSIFYRKFGMNIHVANLLQSGMFSVFHLSNVLYDGNRLSNVSAQMMSSLISGMVSGYAYYYTNSILPSFLAHALNNVIATSIEYTNYKQWSNEIHSKSAL